VKTRGTKKTKRRRKKKRVPSGTLASKKAAGGEKKSGVRAARKKKLTNRDAVKRVKYAIGKKSRCRSSHDVGGKICVRPGDGLSIASKRGESEVRVTKRNGGGGKRTNPEGTSTVNLGERNQSFMAGGNLVGRRAGKASLAGKRRADGGFH